MGYHIYECVVRLRPISTALQMLSIRISTIEHEPLIDGVHVDGVSLTHGQNPRNQIWTFANAIDEIHSNEWVCPCTKTNTPYTGVVPPFIGNDYFCDTGSRYNHALNQF